MMQMLITNITVPTTEASPAAVPVATMSAAISSYVTEPTTERRNQDQGTPRTDARLKRPMTMEMDGTTE